METTATATATATGVLDYFLPLGFVSTYGRIFQIFRDRWIAFTGIAFVMYAVGWIFSILLSLVWGNDIRIVGFSSIYGYAFEFMWEIYGYAFYHYAYELEVGSNLAFYFVEVALYYVFAGFAHGALVLLTMHWYVHQSQHPIDAFESAVQKCWSLVGLVRFSLGERHPHRRLFVYLRICLRIHVGNLRIRLLPLRLRTGSGIQSCVLFRGGGPILRLCRLRPRSLGLVNDALVCAPEPASDRRL